MNTLLLPMAGLLIGVLTLVVYYIKKRDEERDSKLYSKVVICNVIYALFGIFTFAYGLVFENVFVMEILEKLHMIMTLGMIILLGYYLLIGSNFSSKVEKVCLTIMSIIGGCFSAIMFLSPIEVGVAGGLIYGNGFAYSVVLTCIVGFLLFDCFFAFYNLSKNKNFGYSSSFITLVTLYGLCLVLRAFSCELFFENFVISFVILMMYLMVENPHLKEIDRLQDEKKVVQNSNDGKSEFITNMSKEIRMPLNSIVGLTEDILGHREELPKEVVEDVHDISRASQSLLEIVDDILEFNDSDNLASEIVEVTYNFNDEIGAFLREFDMKNKKANVSFTFSIDDDIPFELIGDVNHIKEVVGTLLNSSYANTDAGNFDFTAKCLNEGERCELVLKIQDTSKNSNVDFSEINFLIENMAGKMNIHKQDDGLLVLIHIPQKISNMSKFIKAHEENKDNLNDNYGHRRILIVDDNVLNIKVTSKALVDFGFEIDSVESGEACIDRIQGGYIYDLILMDIMMPDMDGEETFKKLKEIEGFSTPVMALTADAEVGAKARYVSQGFIDYIAKPFSRDQIKSRLDLIFGSSKKEEIPIFYPNVDRFKDVETYEFGNEKKIVEDEEIETL